MFVVKQINWTEHEYEACRSASYYKTQIIYLYCDACLFNDYSFLKYFKLFFVSLVNETGRIYLQRWIIRPSDE